MASMHKATASNVSDRHFFTADDALDVVDDEDYDEMERSITWQHGLKLQIKTTGVRKGKSRQPSE